VYIHGGSCWLSKGRQGDDGDELMTHFWFSVQRYAIILILGLAVRFFCGPGRQHFQRLSLLSEVVKGLCGYCTHELHNLEELVTGLHQHLFQ
jgi:hypothetical protein